MENEIGSKRLHPCCSEGRACLGKFIAGEPGRVHSVLSVDPSPGLLGNLPSTYPITSASLSSKSESRSGVNRPAFFPSVNCKLLLGQHHDPFILPCPQNLARHCGPSFTGVDQLHWCCKQTALRLREVWKLTQGHPANKRLN